MWSDRGFYLNSHVPGHWVNRRATILSQEKQKALNSAWIFPSLLLFSTIHLFCSLLSVCTSPIIPLHLLCPASPTSSLLLLSEPHPPPPPPLLFPHPFILLCLCVSQWELSEPNEGQRRDVCPAGGWTGFSPAVGWDWTHKTHKHTHRTPSISIPLMHL